MRKGTAISIPPGARLLLVEGSALLQIVGALFLIRYVNRPELVRKDIRAVRWACEDIGAYLLDKLPALVWQWIGFDRVAAILLRRAILRGHYSEYDL